METSESGLSSTAENILLKQHEIACRVRKSVYSRHHEDECYELDRIVELHKRAGKAKCTLRNHDEAPLSEEGPETLHRMRELSLVRTKRAHLIQLIDAQIHIGLLVVNVAPHDAEHILTNNWLDAVGTSITEEFDAAFSSRDANKMKAVLLRLMATRDVVCGQTKIYK